MQVVVFAVDGQRFALRLEAVQRVVRAVAVTPLPGAPEVVLGAIDVAGAIVPVFDVRRRFRGASEGVRASDEFLIAKTKRRAVALQVDAVQGVVEHEAASNANPARLAPGLERFDGVMQLEEGLVLIHDLEAFLSREEERSLDASLERLPS